MSEKSSAPPTRVPTLKLVRDIRLATRKLHSAEDKIRIAGWVRTLGKHRRPISRRSNR